MDGSEAVATVASVQATGVGAGATVPTLSVGEADRQTAGPIVTVVGQGGGVGGEPSAGTGTGKQRRNRRTRAELDSANAALPYHCAHCGKGFRRIGNKTPHEAACTGPSSQPTRDGTATQNPSRNLGGGSSIGAGGDVVSRAWTAFGASLGDRIPSGGVYTVANVAQMLSELGPEEDSDEGRLVAPHAMSLRIEELREEDYSLARTEKELNSICVGVGVAKSGTKGVKVDRLKRLAKATAAIIEEKKAAARADGAAGAVDSSRAKAVTAAAAAAATETATTGRGSGPSTSAGHIAATGSGRGGLVVGQPAVGSSRPQRGVSASARAQRQPLGDVTNTNAANAGTLNAGAANAGSVDRLRVTFAESVKRGAEGRSQSDEEKGRVRKAQKAGQNARRFKRVKAAMAMDSSGDDSENTEGEGDDEPLPAPRQLFDNTPGRTPARTPATPASAPPPRFHDEQKCPCDRCLASRASSSKGTFVSTPISLVYHDKLDELRQFNTADWDRISATEKEGVLTYVFRCITTGDTRTWTSSQSSPRAQPSSSWEDDDSPQARADAARERLERTRADFEEAELRHAAAEESLNTGSGGDRYYHDAGADVDGGVETDAAAYARMLNTLTQCASECRRALSDVIQLEEAAHQADADLEEYDQEGEGRVGTSSAVGFGTSSAVGSDSHPARPGSVSGSGSVSVSSTSHPPTLPRHVTAAALSCGLQYEQVSAFMVSLGLCPITSRSFYETQKIVGNTVTEMAEETFEVALDMCEGKKIKITTDAQYDTSRNGHYCIVTFIDVDSECVLFQSVVTRKDAELLANHNGATNMSEPLATRRALSGHPETGEEGLIARLKEKNSEIGEVIHDNNGCVDTIIRDVLPDAHNSKDMWHEAKGKITEPVRNLVARNIPGIKELNAYYVAKAKGSLGQMIKTHFYHACNACLQAEDEDPIALLVRFRTTLFRHISGDHTLCSGQCSRGPTRPTIRPGTPGFEALDAALKDFLSEAHLRFFLKARESYLSEALHTVYIKYASKRIFWGVSWVWRNQLAAIDWNCNIGRRVLKTRDRKDNGAGNYKTRNKVEKVKEKKTYLFRQELIRRSIFTFTTEGAHVVENWMGYLARVVAE